MEMAVILFIIMCLIVYYDCADLFACLILGACFVALIVSNFMGVI